MPESYNDANQRMADRFSRGAPARGITSVAGSIRSAAGTVGGRGNWTAEAAKANSDAALRAARAEGGPAANARAVDAGPQGQEGPSAGSINALAVQKPFDSSVPEELRIAPLEPLSFAVPRYSNIDAPFDELLTPSSGGGGAAACPLDIAVDPSTGEVTLAAVGTINGIVPVLSALFAPASGTRYLIANVTLALGVASSVNFSLESSIPAPFTATQGAPPTLLKIFTHAISDREAARVIDCGSLWANPVELFRTDKTSPVPAGERPFISWYGYDLKTV